VSQGSGEVRTGESAAASEPAVSGNGSHVAAPAPERVEHAPEHAPREPVAREYHAEPRELGATHEPAPIAHFEPQPKPDTGGQQNKPYVVWSSAPAPSEPTGGREPEE
jgi:hypothetical protein